MKKMKKKTKRIIGTTILLVLGVGLTALVGYFSRGFDDWTKEGWRDRIQLRVPEPDEDEEPAVSDEEPASSEAA